MSADRIAELEAQVAMWRDCFAEITAKATPYGNDDPIRCYIIPAGPLHRAAGKTGYQMFEGERMITALTEYIREMEANVIPKIMDEALRQRIAAARLRIGLPASDIQ